MSHDGSPREEHACCARSNRDCTYRPPGLFVRARCASRSALYPSSSRDLYGSLHEHADPRTHRGHRLHTNNEHGDTGPECDDRHRGR